MIRGLDRLKAQLRALESADYLPALEIGAQEAIVPEMQRLTPVDTGELRSSEGAEIDGDVVIVFAGTDHSTYVELGTSKMAAQPYMRPAIDTNIVSALKITAREVDKIMARVIR